MFPNRRSHFPLDGILGGLRCNTSQQTCNHLEHHIPTHILFWHELMLDPCLREIVYRLVNRRGDNYDLLSMTLSMRMTLECPGKNKYDSICGLKLMNLKNVLFIITLDVKIPLSLEKRADLDFPEIEINKINILQMWKSLSIDRVCFSTNCFDYWK